MKWPSKQVRDQLAVYGTAAVLSACAIGIAIWWIGPAPPSRITMATGSPGGAYATWGEAYRRKLAEIGIHVELVETQGAIDNLSLLESGETDVAFLQSGLPQAENAERTEALASIAPEPAWIFASADVEDLRDLAGLSIAGGFEGSGTLAFSQRLVAITGLGDEGTTVEPLGGDEAASALTGGRIDAAIFISAVANERISDLLRNDQTRLVAVPDAAGLTRGHAWLSQTALLGGSVDYQNDVPPQSITMLSATALLAAGTDLHPALVDVLLDAAGEVNNAQGLFSEAGTYPRPPETVLPANEDALRYLEDGQSFLRRYLPFWVASFVERAWILALPLLTVMFPLFRIAPPTYRWRISARINKHYARLNKVEAQLDNPRDETDPRTLLSTLEEMDDKATHTTVPVAFMSDLYDLRRHIAMVRARVEDRIKEKRAA